MTTSTDHEVITILLDAVKQAADEGGITRFEPDDAERFVVTAKQTFQLRDLAQAYATLYEGNFQFMLEMKWAATRGLTNGQAKGVINCMLAEVRKRQTEALGTTITNNQYPVNVPHGTYTVVLEDESHVTLRLKEPEWSEGKTVAQYLSGADNESAYTGFAFVNGRRFNVWRKFANAERLSSALNTLLTGDAGEAGLRYAMQSGRCYRCGRTLTVPTSLHRGLGPDCAEILGVA